jgi:hypothetical protein
MKKLLLLAVVFATVSSYAQTPESPHDTISNDKMTITYGRPYKKGRDVFGGLEKFGSVWRLGANEATQITFKSDVKFGDYGIHAGTYTLFALVNEKEWTFILNSQLGQWGAFGYQKNKDKDVASITVPVKKLDQPVEQFTMRFGANNSVIAEWDRTQVELPLRF